MQWELRPLPGYSAPSDAVPMRCAAATPGGRVFLGGGDGRVYELTYRGEKTLYRLKDVCIMFVVCSTVFVVCSLRIFLVLLLLHELVLRNTKDLR